MPTRQSATRTKTQARTTSPLKKATRAKTSLGALPEWTLADLYAAPDAPEISRDLERAEKDAERLVGRYKGRLAAMGGDGAALAKAIKAYEDLAEIMSKLGSYAGLYYAGDQTDPARAKFQGDVGEKLTRISTQLTFFELELNAIDEASLAKAMREPALAHYKPWLDDLRKEKPHQLDERLEQLFDEMGQTARGAWSRLFSETLAALRFNVKGEKGPLSLEPTLNFLSDSDEKKRRAAAEALAEVFADNARLFTHITNTLAKSKEISDRWRGFEDVAARRHLANRVEAPVVDALVGSVRAAYPRLSHRYYALKAKWLGKTALAHWDRNAPLPERPDRVIPWDEAKAKVLDSYGRFAPEMEEIARRFFDRKWIDAPVRPGKASGAFSASTVPSAHPYVLLNYQGKVRDVTTLAHELGHGVHQILAARQGLFLSSTPLTLAETASVFGEMLTFEALLAETANPRERKALIAAKVEDMLNTVVRQIAFYTFERKVHEERRKGELTSDRLAAIWLEVQSESLGPAIDLKPGYETFWMYIPHFIHSPFYVYAYAFGDCLVNSLYGLYREAHPGFVAKYFDLLKAGGSKHHTELLAPFGLDARDPAFWNKGLAVIEGMIDELEEVDRAVA